MRKKRFSCYFYTSWPLNFPFAAEKNPTFSYFLANNSYFLPKIPTFLTSPNAGHPVNVFGVFTLKLREAGRARGCDKWENRAYTTQ